MKEAVINFQINPDVNKQQWDIIKPKHIREITWEYGVKLAKRIASLYKAEIRLTSGLGDVRNFNGTYINYK